MGADEAIQQLAIHFVPPSYQAILAALEENDELSMADLCGMIKCDKSTLSVSLGKMTTIYKVIHICEWRAKEGGGRPSPVYRLGKGANKKKPKRKTAAELCATWRAKTEVRLPPPYQSFTEMLRALHAI